MKILTFDIEDWFHILDHPDTRTEYQWNSFPSRIEENVERILTVISQADVKATFFCLGWIAEKYPRVIRNICDSGYEIACHSSRHQLAYEQTPEQFRQDLVAAKSVIEDTTGVGIDTYRVPGFSFTKASLWAFDALAEEGIKVDCSIFPAARGHGGLPQFKTANPCNIISHNGHKIKEFPLNAYSLFGSNIIFSGGGYFRLFPYWILKYLFSNSDYVMTYFHPRDFDPKQPKLTSLSMLRKFKSYYGLKEAEKKLISLLNDFQFTDVQEAVSNYCWDKAQTIELYKI